MQEREKRALAILENYPIYIEMPASLSGKTHIRETQEEHLKLVNNILNHLCDEFNIQGDSRDILLAAGWLHDLGLYVITKEGNSPVEEGWKYYEKTGYSRLVDLMRHHGTIGSQVLRQHKIEDQDQICKLIACHMSHWYPDEPQPENLMEYLLCAADYIASRGEGIFRYDK